MLIAEEFLLLGTHNHTHFDVIRIFLFLTTTSQRHCTQQRTHSGNFFECKRHILSLIVAIIDVACLFVSHCAYDAVTTELN